MRKTALSLASTIGPTDMHTPTSLTTLIANHLEPDHADRVLAALKPLDGQLITTRLLDKLPGGRVEWRLTRDMGYTKVANRAYKHHRAEGIELMLARSEGSVPLDVAWVERENPHQFAGRRERNALRAQAMANKEALAKLAAVMNELEDLQKRVAAAKVTFAAYTGDNTPYRVVRYELERACGLRD